MKVIILSTLLLSITSTPFATNLPLTLPPAPSSEGSIYELDSHWTTQNNREIDLSDLKGKVRVVAMGYTSCQYACPRIIADLRRIETELTEPGEGPGSVSISFISIDPENDTPARLKQLERDYQFDPDRWLLLTGDEDGVLELAVALGMKYRKTSAMDFAHSNIITILAPDGKISFQTSEIGTDISKTLVAIRRCLDSTHSGS